MTLVNIKTLREGEKEIDRERERGRERERETDRQTDRQRERKKGGGGYQGKELLTKHHYFRLAWTESIL